MKLKDVLGYGLSGVLVWLCVEAGVSTRHYYENIQAAHPLQQAITSQELVNYINDNKERIYTDVVEQTRSFPMPQIDVTNLPGAMIGFAYVKENTLLIDPQMVLSRFPRVETTYNSIFDRFLQRQTTVEELLYHEMVHFPILTYPDYLEANCLLHPSHKEYADEDIAKFLHEGLAEYFALSATEKSIPKTTPTLYEQKGDFYRTNYNYYAQSLSPIIETLGFQEAVHTIFTSPAPTCEELYNTPLYAQRILQQE